MKNLAFRQVLAVLVIMMQGLSLTAHEVIYDHKLQGADLASNSRLSVCDQWYAHMQENNDWVTYLPGTIPSTAARFHNLDAKGRVILRYEGSEWLHYNDDWVLTLTCDVTTYDAQGNSTIHTAQEFEIQWNPGTNNTNVDVALRAYENTHQIELQVTNVAISGTGNVPDVNNLADDFILDASITINRIFRLNPTIQPQSDDNRAAAASPSWNHRVAFQWSFIEGAEEFELQYVHVSDEIDVLTSRSSLLDWRNATRIITKNQYFETPAVFETGSLYYRVRAVGRQGIDFVHRRDGAWSIVKEILIDDSGSGIPPFESDKNWSYELTHAEWGKQANAVSFFDGSGQPKQVVAKDNATNLAIVSESFLDFEGRPAVNILPSPILPNVAPEQVTATGSHLKFYDHFTKAHSDNQDYDTQHFDLNSNQTNPVGLATTIETAGNFYSSDNPLKNYGLNRHIASATGSGGASFAFTRTRYDNQGRPKEQSGIGPDHGIGSGHSTQYFYGNPSQEKLDRLFGTEVGYASHYRKRMMVDPNGQISLSYENLSGQIIATSLVGDAPRNPDGSYQLKPTEEFAATNDRIFFGEATDDLSNFNSYKQNTQSWDIVYSHLVATTGNHVFNYEIDLTNEEFTAACQGTTYPCEYLLDFNILDPDGDAVAFTGTLEEVGGTTNSIDESSFPLLLSGSSLFKIVLTCDFGKIGNYTIDKKLGLYDLQTKVQAYRDFLENALNTGNLPTCLTTSNIPVECDNTTIADSSDIINGGFDYDCSVLLETLKADMRPGGQYFDNLYLNNEIPDNGWLMNVNYDGPNLDYTNIDFVGLKTVLDLLNAENPLTAYDNTIPTTDHNAWWNYTRDFFNYPEVSAWLDNQNLVNYHPEYPHYDWCFRQKNNGNDAMFNEDLENYNAGTDPEGWISEVKASTSGGTYSIVSDDPYFSAFGSRLVNEVPLDGTTLMNARIEAIPGTDNGSGGLLSMWGLAVVTAIEDLSNSSPSDAQVWPYFAQLYYAEKQKIITLQKKNPCSNPYYTPFLYDKVVTPDPGGDVITSPDYVADLDRSTSPLIWGNAEYCVGTTPSPQSPVFTGWHSGCDALDGSSPSRRHDILEVEFLIEEWKTNSSWLSSLGCGGGADNPNILLALTDQRASGFTIRVPDSEGTVTAIIDANGDGILGAGDDPSLFQDAIDALDPCKYQRRGVVIDILIGGAYPRSGASIKASLESRLNTSGNDPSVTFYTYDCDANDLGIRVSNNAFHCFSDFDINDATLYDSFEDYYYENIELFDCIANSFRDRLSTPDYFAVHTPTEFIIETYEEEPCSTLLESPLAISAPFDYNEYGAYTIVNIPSLPCPTSLPHCLCEDKAYAESLLTSPGPLLWQLYRDEYDPGGLQFSQTDWEDYLTVATTQCAIIANSSIPEDIEAAIEVLELEADEMGLNCFTYTTDPCLEGGDIADFHNQQALLDQVEEQIELFRQGYINRCLNPEVAPDQLTMTYSEQEYDFTLYYYTPAGNLYATVPPEGVQPLPNDNTLLSDIKQQRDEWGDLYGCVEYGTHTGSPLPCIYVPRHRYFSIRNRQLMTIYKYDSFNNMVENIMPDHTEGDNNYFEGDGGRVYGKTKYIYDNIGRIRFSENPKQREAGQASYTRYDARGRILESGEFTPSGGFSSLQNSVETGSFPAEGTGQFLEEYSRSTYDQPSIISNPWEQENLRQRVAAVSYYESESEGASHSTYYSYNIRGDVTRIVHEDHTLISKHAKIKQIEYDFGLVDGLVYQLHYQPGELDQFIHKYEYDGNNRLTRTYTSEDGYLWDKDARSIYRIDGVMARSEIGHYKVQGMDYAYTIHGWIKGVNSTTLNADRDIGQDGALNASSSYNRLNRRIGRDAYGYALHYYAGDYTDINGMGSANRFFANLPSTSGIFTAFTADAGRPVSSLYNGNIVAMQTAILKPDHSPMDFIAKGYHYDQKNRLLNAYTATSTFGASGGVESTNAWTNAMATDRYKVSLAYDRVGNIKSLSRYDGAATPQLMDQLNYQYTYNIGSGSNPNDLLVLNRLRNVDETVAAANYAEDVDDQVLDNYAYDNIGNLIGDDQAEIEEIIWNVSGKIKHIIHTSSSTKPDLEFRYDSQGNRIEKITKPRINGQLSDQLAWSSTYYVRDAQGNVLATYDHFFGIPNLNGSANLPTAFLYNNQEQIVIEENTTVPRPINISNYGSPAFSQGPAPADWLDQYAELFTLKEQHLYGSQRLGMKKKNKLVTLVRFRASIAADHTFTNRSSEVYYKAEAVDLTHKRSLGLKYYEFSNHLGNVLAVVSDKYTTNSTNGINVSWIEPTVVSSNDYYPFGQQMPGRSFNSPDYRYGFNGKEKDETGELGDLTHYDYGFRIYNPGIGKFLSVDPLTASYPWYTPYQFAGNTPIWAIDLDGLEPLFTTESINEHYENATIGTEALNGQEIYLSNNEGKGIWVPAPSSDQIEEIYLSVQKGIERARKDGSVYAADNLERWLRGEGGNVEFPIDKFRRSDAFISALDKNTDRFFSKENSNNQTLWTKAFSLNPGESVIHKDHWETGAQFEILSSQSIRDLYYAWGGINIVSEGVFSITNDNGIIKIEGTVTHKLTDTYNWNPNGQTPIKGAGIIEDNDLLLLEVYKGAKPFTGSGQIRETINVIYDQKKRSIITQDLRKQF